MRAGFSIVIPLLLIVGMMLPLTMHAYAGAAIDPAARPVTASEETLASIATNCEKAMRSDSYMQGPCAAEWCQLPMVSSIVPETAGATIEGALSAVRLRLLVYHTMRPPISLSS